MSAVLDLPDVASERTWSTRETARILDLDYLRVYRWALSLDHQPPGSGSRIRLTPADVLTMYAWKLLADQSTQGDPPTTRRLRQSAARALRARLAPYVVILGPDRADTATTWEAAVLAAGCFGRPHVRTVLDLTPIYNLIENAA